MFTMLCCIIIHTKIENHKSIKIYRFVLILRNMREDNIFLLVPNRFSLKISGLRIPYQEIITKNQFKFPALELFIDGN
jgi:hypothetical protein